MVCAFSDAARYWCRDQDQYGEVVKSLVAIVSQALCQVCSFTAF